MNALEQAQQLATQAQSYYDTAEEKDGNAYYRSKGDTAMQHAAIFAAVAQAEQLKRVADMVEGYLATYCDPAVFGQDSNEPADAAGSWEDYQQISREHQEQLDAMAEARTDYADPLN